MIVELNDRLRNPVQVAATRVLVTDDAGTPLVLVVAMARAPGHEHVRCFRAGDSDFQDALHDHGVLRTVTVSVLDPLTLQPR